MKIIFTDSFSKSIKRIHWQDSVPYKIWDIVRNGIPRFLKNIWAFRKPLWYFHWWDYRYTLDMLEKSITIMEEGMRTRGWEVRETLNPKLKSMTRALEILRNNKESNYIERAEIELGDLFINDWQFEELENGNKKLIDNQSSEERAHNRKVFERAKQIEDAEWIELWEIFKGTKNSKKAGEKYDGSDMRAWWD